MTSPDRNANPQMFYICLNNGMIEMIALLIIMNKKNKK